MIFKFLIFVVAFSSVFLCHAAEPVTLNDVLSKGFNIDGKLPDHVLSLRRYNNTGLAAIGINTPYTHLRGHLISLLKENRTESAKFCKAYNRWMKQALADVVKEDLNTALHTGDLIGIGMVICNAGVAHAVSALAIFASVTVMFLL